MKPRKSISVDFRPSKTRDDGTAVQIERDCSIEIGAVSQHMGFTQLGKNFSARMPVSIAHSHGNYSESRMYSFEHQGNGGRCAAVVAPP
jgi:hypothetical protein